MNDTFCSCVNRRCRFIQDQYRRIGNGSSCDRKKLTLSLRQFFSVSAQARLITFRKHSDESVCMSQLCCLINFLICRIQFPVTNVFHNRSCKQMCILKNDTKRSSQISLFNLVYINIIITDLSVLNIIETIDQVCDRCLSRSRRTDKSKFLSRLRVQSQIMKHHVVFRISERHIIKSHVAFQLRICHCAVCLMRMFPCPQACSFFTLRKISLCILLCVYKSNISFVYFRLFIHHIKNTFRTCKSHDD